MHVEFRRVIDLMVLNNVCQCNAFANVSSLDLKFFVHYGAFMLQPLAGYVELIGSDVNLIHRLMKNRVVAETGIALLTAYTPNRRSASLGLLSLRAWYGIRKASQISVS